MPRLCERGLLALLGIWLHPLYSLRPPKAGNDHSFLAIFLREQDLNIRFGARPPSPLRERSLNQPSSGVCPTCAQWIDSAIPVPFQGAIPSPPALVVTQGAWNRLQVAAGEPFNSPIPAECCGCRGAHAAVREAAVAGGPLGARRSIWRSVRCERMPGSIPSQRSEREPQRKSERTTIVERVRDPSEVGFGEVRAGILELRVVRQVE